MSNLLISWDGGWTEADTPEQAEAFILNLLQRWEAAGDPGTREDFRVTPNDPDAITDPAELVKGRRYKMVNTVHPEYAGGEGVFDGIRPSEWTGDPSVYFVEGRIGDIEQGLFGFPADQPHAFTEVAQ